MHAKKPWMGVFEGSEICSHVPPPAHAELAEPQTAQHTVRPDVASAMHVYPTAQLAFVVQVEPVVPTPAVTQPNPTNALFESSGWHACPVVQPHCG